MSLKKFDELNLSPEIVRAIDDLGFEYATPIQSQAIDFILEGRDVFGQSQTGTGKTAAFALPCIEKIDPSVKGIQALILCPTRELAMQVGEEFRKFLKYKSGIKVCTVYGGQPIDRQISQLRKGVQIVIGTPGRVMDHLKRKTIKTQNINTIILDEADEMLTMGFREDIEEILGQMNDERQTILFSATLPKSIRDIINNYQDNPEHIKIQKKEITVSNIEQQYVVVSERNKLELLCRIVDVKTPNLAIVFCNTKRLVDEVVEKLQKRGYFAEGLHGDLKQLQRDFVMKKFRNKTLQILVATDVAARGIDVENVDVVINFDLPQETEYYVHRIGRTGRAGKNGYAITFVTNRETRRIKDIVSHTKATINETEAPTINDIEKAKANEQFNKLKNVIDNGDLEKYSNLLDNLLSDGYDIKDVASALLRIQLHNEDVEDVDFSNEKKKGKNKKKGTGKTNLTNPSRLFLSLGKRDRISPKDIVGAIANEANISSSKIGAIDIYKEFTFVDVEKNCVDKVIKKLNGKKIRNKTLSVEKAKKGKR